MIRSFSVFLLLAGSLALAGAAAAHEKTPAPSPSVPAVDARTAPALAVVERFSTALQAGDLDTVGTLLADDVLILESGGAERSREEYLGHHAISDAAFLKASHVQRLRQTAQTEGTLAWIGTESEIHTSKDGQPLTVLSTETMILRESAEGWRIVHIHWSSRPKK